MVVAPFQTTCHHRSQISFTDNSYDSTDSGQDDDHSNFDTAFIAGHRLIPEVENTETAAATKLVDYSISSDNDESACSDPSEISTCSDNPSNISSISDVVRNNFNSNSETTEDDEMDSFMKTKYFDEFSDEGLSSMDSEYDVEKEFIV